MSSDARFPEEQEFLEAFGVSPALVGTDESVYAVEIPTGDDVIALSYDVVARSVRLRAVRAGRVLVQVYREGVTLLGITHGAGSTSLLVQYDVRTARGRLEAQVYPHVTVDDTLLWQ